MEKPVLPYQVGEWSINPKSGIAQREDETVHLEPKASELLSYLASHPGEVISRSELLNVVWPGVIVGDEVITNAIAKLRRSLHDDPKSPKLIETIPKRGYRIIAPVSEIQAQENVATYTSWFRPVTLVSILAAIVIIMISIKSWSPATDIAPDKPVALALPDKPSIAVLPFINMSNDSGQEYFVDGMTEDLITDLSRVSGLFVIARNSSFAYKGKKVTPRVLRKELGVQYIIEGSVRKLESRLRVNIQLIDTKTGGHLWAERYDVDIDNVFTIQDKMTEKIVSALSVNITEIEKAYAEFQETHKHSTYEAFLKGWAAYRLETPESFAEAIKHFESAVKEDPAYGRALAALAAVYWDAYQKLWYRRLGMSPRSLVWQRANEYLERSMVAPTPLAHKIASAMLMTNRRFDEATTEARRAIAIDTNDPLGYIALADILIYTGTPENAEPLVRKAMRLDPQDQNSYLFPLGKAQLVKGDVKGAISSLEQVTERQPDNRLAWMALISAYGTNGQSEEAGAAITTLNKLQRRDKLVSFTVANAREHWPFKTESDGDRLLDGLRKAGVPEG
jgi:TolB-like protein/DNA-binding winged helix-turn-helix (wHTH) protein/thioredoxin-like negative regulator of GroEL